MVVMTDTWMDGLTDCLSVCQFVWLSCERNRFASLITIGDLQAKLKILGETKHLIAKLTKIEGMLKDESFIHSTL